MPQRRPGLLVVSTLFAICLGASARADLTAYEPFNYGPEGFGLIGMSGGGSFGFASPWAAGGFNASVHNNYVVDEQSLSYQNLLTSGGSARSGPTNAIAGLTRTFSAPLGTAGTVRYYSVLLRPEGTLHEGAFSGFFGLNLESPGEPEIFAGKPGGGQIGQYVIEDRGGGGQVASGVPAAVGETTFLVVKADFRSGSDVFTLFLNPTPGAPEPASGVVKTSAVGTASGFTLYSTGAFSIDELRLGTTYADVTPAIPEPTGIIALAGAGASLLLLRKGNRRDAEAPRRAPRSWRGEHESHED